MNASEHISVWATKHTCDRQFLRFGIADPKSMSSWGQPSSSTGRDRKPAGKFGLGVELKGRGALPMGVSGEYLYSNFHRYLVPLNPGRLFCLFWLHRWMMVSFSPWVNVYFLCSKTSSWPGMVAHACNPSTLGGQGGRIPWAQEFETRLGNIVRYLSLLKLK